MQPARVVIDPLWQCLCPAWSQGSLLTASRFFSRPRRPRTPYVCLTTIRRPAARTHSQTHLDASEAHHDAKYTPFAELGSGGSRSWSRRPKHTSAVSLTFDLHNESTPSLYGRLHAAAFNGHTEICRVIAENLVKERQEKPNLQIYNALILSNTHHYYGRAWRVSDYLEEMEAEGLQPDVGTCHAVLKVLAVHLDHLLRSDILDYMQQRWFQLSDDGAHDVVAGLLRDALFEQAVQRLDTMRGNMQVDAWLWDLATYMLTEAGEIEESCRIMRMRSDAGESNLSLNLWNFLLDKSSAARHHDATSFIWNSQVNQKYLNPSSGVCLNVLATAGRAGDAVLGTEVFGVLSKRGTAFSPVHYELLITSYLSADPPDYKRAISILTIMPLEKVEPTAAETRALFEYLRDKPELVKECVSVIRELHEQDRIIPIGLLNLLIECYVEQENLPEAMNLYKQIHTFAPAKLSAQKSFANIETFNILLKGCRFTNPPNEQQASFLVSELLALGIVPTSLTYDRLILVFVRVSSRLRTEMPSSFPSSSSSPASPPAYQANHSKALELLDWALRHFADMQGLGWLPRFGTLELLASELATVGDARCWDVLQTMEDHGDEIDGFSRKGRHVRVRLEAAWQKAQDAREMDLSARDVRQLSDASATTTTTTTTSHEGVRTPPSFPAEGGAETVATRL